MSPDSLVLGATGFVGRALVAELLRQGRTVAAAVRRSDGPLRAWLAGQGVDTGGLTVVTADITRPGLGIEGLPDVRDVYNCAARYAFGLDLAEARAANVTGALNAARWTAGRRAPRRLVHLSGYRVSARDDDGARLGAYEATKREGDAAVRALAAELGLPLTVANPSTIAGPGQYIGLASVVADLWNGRLPLAPGGPRTFVPVVELEYFARFLAALPEDPGTAGGAYWVLDEDTPELPGLLRLLAGHTGVRAPRGHVPVGLLRALPRALTGADPETLPFLSEERYPTGPAHLFAEFHGLTPPPVERVLRDWADHLVATRFGAVPAPDVPHGFHDVAGARTWMAGDRTRPAHVLLPGAPLTTDSWARVAHRLEGAFLTADLPGLGRSGAAGTSADAWLDALLAPLDRPVLTAHASACAPALRYARRHPERIGGLVLVAPPFLVRAPAVPRRAAPERLAAALGVPRDEALATAAALLRRPGAFRRATAAVRAANRAPEASRRALAALDLPVTVVTGGSDAPPPGGNVRIVTVPGGGHCPHLTAPEAVARTLDEAAGTSARRP
ncbi:alpha/beta fold hydrolase [Actinomadura kijaniata]|uniref:alpha/beta fold hydrolase n=1 Tax=Actinomadura kijaniata TaxID=46161 RepID=UPI002FEBDD18